MVSANPKKINAKVKVVAVEKTDRSDKAGRARTAGRGTAKVREGTVVSTKMEKTVVVAVSRMSRHSTYGKFVRVTKKYQVHDERSEAKVGDRVKIVECRPMSKLKNWRLYEVTGRAVEV